MPKTYQRAVYVHPEAWMASAQRVPQRMIASYLGITPEALSKLRGDKAKK